MGVELNDEEKTIEQAVKTAGETLLSYWKPAEGAADTLGVEKKPDGSLVTTADFASNDILVSALQAAFPNDGILSEELPMQDSLRQKKRIWIIDPLDGTQSFVNGRDDFSILVARTYEHVSEFGFMLFPARGPFVIARRGAGAWDRGKRLQVSLENRLRPKSVYYRNFKPRKPELCYDQTMDSGCAFLMLASGVFDGLIIKIVSHREWDLAAPAIAVEESGGRVTNEHGEALRFVPGQMNCRYFVASNGRVHDELLSIIPAEDK